jgi:hypothetical protein
MIKYVLAAVVAGCLAASLPSGFAYAQATGTQDTKKETKETKAKKPISAGLAAMRERQKKCGAEWKEAKAAGKTQGQTWPKFWSACNKRLKGAT